MWCRLSHGAWPGDEQPNHKDANSWSLQELMIDGDRRDIETLDETLMGILMT